MDNKLTVVGLAVLAIVFGGLYFANPTRLQVNVTAPPAQVNLGSAGGTHTQPEYFASLGFGTQGSLRFTTSSAQSLTAAQVCTYQEVVVDATSTMTLTLPASDSWATTCLPRDGTFRMLFVRNNDVTSTPSASRLTLAAADVSSTIISTTSTVITANSTALLQVHQIASTTGSNVIEILMTNYRNGN